MKKRKESVRYIVKWIIDSTMYFRVYRRDSAATRFQMYLIEVEGIDPADVRIIMQ
jgi:hypothetical protein